MGEGSSRVVASACQGCLANCPVLLTLDGDGVTDVTGNSACRATRGAVCPNVYMALEQRDDPDRLLYPMRRTNPAKGRDERPCFERISWDEALDALASRLLDLRERGEGHRVAFAKGRATGIGDLFFRALPDVYGTPNRLNHDGICAEAEKLATGCLDGVWDYHDYDFENARCVLLWGTDPLAGNRMKARFIREAAGLREHAQVFAMSPNRPLSAKLGTWLPVLPGTDGALACSLAHVILVEGLWNRSYVGDFAAGNVDSFSPGVPVESTWFAERETHGLVAWWNLALKDATPEWAAPLCGIGADEIRGVARAFAAAGPRAVSWVSPGVTMCARGLYAGMACYALNGLVGSVGARGGVLRFPSAPVAKLPETGAFQDKVARAANARPVVDGRSCSESAVAKNGRPFSNQLTNNLADAILADEPYRLDTVIAYWVNWAYSCTGAQRWEQALAKLPFFVHVTTHLSETSMFADIVLPARHHLFEDWGFVRSRQGGVTSVALEQPALDSPGECRGDESEVSYALAQAFAKRGFAEPLRYFQSLVDPCTGRPVRSGRELGEVAVKIMLQPMWDTRFSGASDARIGADAVGTLCESSHSGSEDPDRSELDGAQARWKAFRERGVWNSEPVAVRTEGQPVQPLPTPTGLFEFKSETLRALVTQFCELRDMSADQALAAWGYEACGELAFVPHFEPPVRLGDEQKFPFVFSQHRSRLSLEGRAANTQRFQALKGSDPGDEPWDDVLKIHPSDMGLLGLADGDAIRVSSVQGSIVCRAKTWDGTRPGVVVKCYGQGHWAYGHVAAADFERGIPRGGNNNELLAAVVEGASGATARHGGLMRVRIEGA